MAFALFLLDAIDLIVLAAGMSGHSPFAAVWLKISISSPKTSDAISVEGEPSPSCDQRKTTPYHPEGNKALL
ncbi:hypothetical protein BOO88_19435 [Stutzerimonas stutzeri]|jgi:hypothetical protein|nr:hypothetical protein BOO89_27235 [Stutzerimonas stutzeri]AZO90973.1 hypothetical protein BOO88_19435 [Stutzerimonas stutzeri]